MDSFQIPYKKTNYFSKMILDYLEEKKSVQSFYHRFPSLDNFSAQIEEKTEGFPFENRKVLVDALTHQYKNTSTGELTQQHLDKLLLPNTFTITTGHQLNLFSGPIYFLYKIVSVINLCKELQEKYPNQNFVPIYWMASEDHDLEEIQYFNFKNKKIFWEKESGGAVGKMSTDGLEDVYQKFSALLNTGVQAQELRDLFKKSYVAHTNLADATRYLVNALFGTYGLVVLDGDDQQLKNLFKPYALKELKEQVSHKEVTKTGEHLRAQSYPQQVHPREINLFYSGHNFRERIIKTKEGYKVQNRALSFSSPENIFEHLENSNDNVSGNALLRPLYQEVILPNLCYVGGGGELSYWMQLKSTFKAFEVPFPMLLLRNSALLITEKQHKKLNKLEVSVEDLFLSQNQLIVEKVKEKSDIHFDFNAKRKQLKESFKSLEQIALQTDPSFMGAVKAQEKKQLKGFDHLEKRLLKAEKKKMYDLVTRIEIIQNDLFPNQSLEERYRNFSEYYEYYGKDLLSTLFKTLNPLALEFTVIID